MDSFHSSRSTILLSNFSEMSKYILVFIAFLGVNLEGQKPSVIYDNISHDKYNIYVFEGGITPYMEDDDTSYFEPNFSQIAATDFAINNILKFSSKGRITKWHRQMLGLKRKGKDYVIFVLVKKGVFPESKLRYGLILGLGDVYEKYTSFGILDCQTWKNVENDF